MSQLPKMKVQKWAKVGLRTIRRQGEKGQHWYPEQPDVATREAVWKAILGEQQDTFPESCQSIRPSSFCIFVANLLGTGIEISIEELYHQPFKTQSLS